MLCYQSLMAQPAAGVVFGALADMCSSLLL
jgi:hypothetical protein